jgi:CRISPR type III-B/RAMP module-associated protein Cmr5
MENQRLNIDQNRAKFAFDNKTSNKSSNYDAMVKKTGAYLQTNGLVYTLAFLEQKDKGVFETLWKWHCIETGNSMRLTELREKTQKEFISALLSLDDEKIRLVTIETISLLAWLRRFVKDDE